MPDMRAFPMNEPVIEPDLPICDPHHHLWVRDGAGVYLIEAFTADIQAGGHRIESTVFVEAYAFYSPRRPPGFEFVGETEAMAGIAAMAESGVFGPTRVCAAIAGRADLHLGAATTAKVLEAHLEAGGGRFRGVRAVGAWHASPEIRKSHTNPPEHLYLTPAFQDGFGQLAPLGLSFEAWQFHTQLPDVTALARKFPDTRIMLNHVGGVLGIGPYRGRRQEVFAAWSADLAELAACPNVHVKLGGLGMPLCGFDFHKRQHPASSEELAAAWRPYIETSIELFGVDRCMFESNFPVDGASCSYGLLWNAMKRIAAGCSDTEKAKLFRDNAMDFYRVEL